AADGHISNEEVIDFHAAIGKANILRGASRNYISQMIDKVIRVLRSQGMDALLTQCAAALTPDLHEGVFANACDLVFSDGNVDPSEVAVMDRIKGLLHISDQFAADVAEVFKAKGSV
ncbi:MAG: tellurite resistance TerB family protein, partial [Bacteroidota bacterium]